MLTMNKRDEYNLILKRLFEQVMPQIDQIAQNKPCPSEYNRVRRMCKVYGSDIMNTAIKKLEETLSYSNPPQFSSVAQMLGYFNGIAKKELLNNASLPSKITVDDLFKDM